MHDRDDAETDQERSEVLREPLDPFELLDLRGGAGRESGSPFRAESRADARLVARPEPDGKGPETIAQAKVVDDGRVTIAPSASG